MYSLLHEWLSDKQGGQVFSVFGPWHFFYIGLTLTVLGAVLYFRKKQPLERKCRDAGFFLDLAFGMYLADFFLMPLAYGEIDVEKLPFHACTAMCVLGFLSYRIPALEKYRSSITLLGMISNLVYLIYPAGVMWHQVHPLSYRVIQTLLFHSTMTVHGILALVYDRKRVAPGQWRKDLTVVIGMTLWAMLGNFLYNGPRFYNWFFVVRDPFYIFPEGIAPFVMPFLNVALFFAVEMTVRLLLRWLRCAEE